MTVRPCRRQPSSDAVTLTPFVHQLAPVWQGASTSRYSPKLNTSNNPTNKGYPFLNCDVGDIFDVLDDSLLDEHALVRKSSVEAPSNTASSSSASASSAGKPVGWLPVTVLNKLKQ